MKTKKYAGFSAFFLLAILSFNYSQAQVKKQTLDQIQALLNEKNSRTPTEQKIDSRLLQAVREKVGQQMAKGVNLDAANVNADASGNFNIDIRATVTDDLLVRLQQLGANIIFPSAEYHTIRATVNLSMVKTIAAYPEVQFIEPAVKSQTVGSDKLKPQVNISGDQSNLLQKKLSTKEREANIRKQLITYLRNQGSLNASDDVSGNLPITSEGDRTHRADDTRNTFGYSGEGIKIGVLSDSYNALQGAPADITSGNLPGKGNPFGNITPVTVVQDKKIQY